MRKAVARSCLKRASSILERAFSRRPSTSWCSILFIANCSCDVMGLQEIPMWSASFLNVCGSYQNEGFVSTASFRVSIASCVSPTNHAFPTRSICTMASRRSTCRAYFWARGSLRSHCTTRRAPSLCFRRFELILPFTLRRYKHVGSTTEPNCTPSSARSSQSCQSSCDSAVSMFSGKSELRSNTSRRISAACGGKTS
jgi:hypothetical protein